MPERFTIRKSLKRASSPEVGHSLLDLMIKCRVVASYAIEHCKNKGYPHGKAAIVKMLTLVNQNPALVPRGFKVPAKLAYKRFFNDNEKRAREAIYQNGYYSRQGMIGMSFRRNKKLYQLMPWQGDMDLFDYILNVKNVKTGKKDVKQALAIMRHVCAAIDELHQHHGPHGDVKPENIRVFIEGDLKISRAVMIDIGDRSALGDCTSAYLSIEKFKQLVTSCAEPIKKSKPEDFKSAAIVMSVLLQHMGFATYIGYQIKKFMFNHEVIESFRPIPHRNSTHLPDHDEVMNVFDQLREGINPFSIDSAEDKQDQAAEKIVSNTASGITKNHI